MSGIENGSRFDVTRAVLQPQGDSAMSAFDAAILQELCDTEEFVIRTEKHPKSGIVIWVVVAGEDVFVRSWAGTKGRWYRDLKTGGPATLEFAGRQLKVHAVPASDADAVARASREFLHKYRASSHAQEMVRSEILPTTLKLEPR